MWLADGEALPALQDDLEGHFKLMGMIDAILDLRLDQRVSVAQVSISPGGTSQPLTLQHLEHLLEKLVQAKTSDSVDVPEATKGELFTGAQIDEMPSQPSKSAFKEIIEAYVSAHLQA
jgi:hypothetical protein